MKRKVAVDVPMKRNQVVVDIPINNEFSHTGIATVIGKRPYLPYVNINQVNPDGSETLLASIDHKAMNSLVKKWVKAWGGDPQ